MLTNFDDFLSCGISH